MQGYVIRRLLLMVLTLFIVSIIIFVVMNVMPGDVAEAILATGGQGAYSREEVQSLRAQLGLDRPLWIQYGTWLKDLVTLDFGTSLWTKRSIRDELIQRFPLTLELTLLSIAVSLVIALPLGVLSALRQDKPEDYIARIFAVTGIAMPHFWTGTLIILFLVIVFKWTPPLDYVYIWENPWQNLQQFVFPALTLGFYNAAVLARMVRSSLLEVLRQDYVRTAWAKGLGFRPVVFRHALRNAMLPVVTLMGIQTVQLLAGTVIIESLFQIPGLGRALLQSVTFRDWPLMQTLIVLAAGASILVNLCVDFTYAWLDRRITYQ